MPLLPLKVLIRSRLDQSMEEALDLKVQNVNVIRFGTEELPYEQRVLFSNVSVHLCGFQRELLRHKQEARHIQAIKVNRLL